MAGRSQQKPTRRALKARRQRARLGEDSLSVFELNKHIEVLKKADIGRVVRTAKGSDVGSHSPIEHELPITKLASTLGGGASLGLAAAVLVPSVPLVAVAAAVVGLIGSSLLVRRY